MKHTYEIATCLAAELFDWAGDRLLEAEIDPDGVSLAMDLDADALDDQVFRWTEIREAMGAVVRGATTATLSGAEWHEVLDCLASAPQQNDRAWVRGWRRLQVAMGCCRVFNPADGSLTAVRGRVRRGRPDFTLAGVEYVWERWPAFAGGNL